MPRTAGQAQRPVAQQCPLLHRPVTGALQRALGRHSPGRSAADGGRLLRRAVGVRRQGRCGSRGRRFHGRRRGMAVGSGTAPWSGMGLEAMAFPPRSAAHPERGAASGPQRRRVAKGSPRSAARPRRYRALGPWAGRAAGDLRRTRADRAGLLTEGAPDLLERAFAHRPQRAGRRRVPVLPVAAFGPGRPPKPHDSV